MRFSSPDVLVLPFCEALVAGGRLLEGIALSGRFP